MYRGYHDMLLLIHLISLNQDRYETKLSRNFHVYVSEPTFTNRMVLYVISQEYR